MYPEIMPYDHFMLPVSDIHTLYVEQCGNPDGKPVLFVHGGPGGGSHTNSRQFFNPDKYRIILVDQRGCGRSTPIGEMKQNNTQNLIADFEQLRQKLDIDNWLLFGGSWGSTLSLTYAQAHPERVNGLIIRGIFLGRDCDIDWLFGANGAAFIYPDLWQQFYELIPENERDDLLGAYYKRLMSDNEETRRAAADAWCRLEIGMIMHTPDPTIINGFLGTQQGYALALTECHYMLNKLFLKPGQILDNIDIIRHIPTAIVHGRYDTVCALDNAWALKQAWPLAELHIVPNGGHAAAEDCMAEKLIALTDRF